MKRQANVKRQAKLTSKGQITVQRRSLADFLIGAHALVSGYKLLTLDGGLYKKAFPGLRLEIV